MTDHWWLYLWVFPVGLVVGSFLNVCVFRLPDGLSVVSPRSQCPSCQQPIAWFDNIPLISYIWLGRRCRHCQASISLRYPVIELMNGLGYMGIVATFGWTWAAGVYAVFFSALLVVAWIDLDHLIIPDVVSLPGIVMGLLAAATVLPIGLVNAVIGVVLGGGFFGCWPFSAPICSGKRVWGVGISNSWP